MLQGLTQFTYILTFYPSAHICAMFKLDPTEEGAKLDDPEIDTELLYLVLDKVDQVMFF